MEPSQDSELKQKHSRNARLRKLVAELDLEVEVMKDVAAKKRTAYSSESRQSRTPIYSGDADPSFRRC